MCKLMSKTLLTVMVSILITWGAASSSIADLLIVDMKTNYLPGIEFIAARTVIVSGPETPTAQTQVVFTTDPVEDPGIRVAEFDNLDSGVYTVEVQLLMPDGATLDQQRIIVSLSNATAITALIARQGEPPNMCEEQLETVQAELATVTVNLEVAQELNATLQLDLQDIQIELESTQADLSNVQGLLEVANEALATLQNDDDGDGVIAVLDQCVDTPDGEEVDALGCSNVQFCEAIEINSWRDILPCFAADWNEDEAIFRARDCRVDHGVCVAR